MSTHFSIRHKKKNPQGLVDKPLADCFERCVAESNCSIRFCRPPHNRFVNAPCCSESECKGKQKKWNCQIFRLIFVFAGIFWALARFGRALAVAASAVAAWIVGMTKKAPSAPGGIAHGHENDCGHNDVLHVHIGCEITNFYRQWHLFLQLFCHTL